MNWLNVYGLVFMGIILIPNILFAIKHKDAFENKYQNKRAEVIEQISRYACFFLMVFNIPHTYLGFYFPFGKIVYIVVNAVLVLAYCSIWLIFWKKNGLTKALLLSVIPSVMFLFSGVMIASIPLSVFAVMFAISHILISVKNAIAL